MPLVTPFIYNAVIPITGHYKHARLTFFSRTKNKELNEHNNYITMHFFISDYSQPEEAFPPPTGLE